METAASWKICRIRGHPFNGNQCSLFLHQIWNTYKQAFLYKDGMDDGIIVLCFRILQFHIAHNGYIVTYFCYNSQIVGDHDHGGLVFGLKFSHQLQHLRLDRHPKQWWVHLQ